jgi:CheY-like chemotaxis protein
MSISSSRPFRPSSPGAEPADVSGRRLLVLLIEADFRVRRVVRRHLDSFPVGRGNLEVVSLALVEAESGREALLMLSSLTPDLVLLDLTLPEMSGYEVCEYLRASDRLRHIPVLAMSARAMPEDRAAAEEVGASAFLAKPFTRQQLTAHIEMLLALRPASR